MIKPHHYYLRCRILDSLFSSFSPSYCQPGYPHFQPHESVIIIIIIIIIIVLESLWTGWFYVLIFCM